MPTNDLEQINIGTPEAPMYVPKGSPGDLQSRGITPTTENVSSEFKDLTAANSTITSEVLASNEKPLTLPPATPSTSASGTEAYIESQNKTIKAEQEKLLANEKAALEKSKQDISSITEDLGNSGQMREDLYKQEGVDVAKRQVDDYTNQIEAEQMSNRRRIDELKATTGGVLTSGINTEINRINNISISKQADLAILQNASLRKYSTAAEIADRKLEAKLEPMRAKLETLKFFFSENKADFNKKDERLYSDLITQKNREYEEVKSKETEKNTLLKQAVASGGATDADLRILMDETTPYDVALKTTQKVIEKANNKTRLAAAGQTTSFTNEGGVFINTRTGEAFETPEAFFKAAGVSSFEQAYAAGLVSDLSPATNLTYSIQDVGGRTVRFGFDTSGKVVSKVDLGAVKSGSGGGGSSDKNDINEDSTPVVPKTPTANSIRQFLNNMKKTYGGQNEYYDVWGVAADMLKAQGIDPNKYNEQFWMTLHPDGAAGWAKEKEKLKGQKGNSGMSDEEFLKFLNEEG